MGIIFVWRDGRVGLAAPVDLSTPKAADPGWRAALAQRGGWRSAHWKGISAHAAGWQSLRSVPGGSVLLTGPASSSLDCAWYWAQAGGFPPGTSLLSISQWAGRGQFGRNWISPAGNLYAAWRVPERTADAAGGLSLALRMGYSIVQVLADLGLHVRLKWPNDVVLDGEKVAGVLCEQRDHVFMVGVGINLVSSPPPEGLREDHAVPAGWLGKHGSSLSPLDLWLRVRAAAEVNLDDPPPVALLERALAYRGQWVEVRAGCEPAFSARVLGVTSQGALRVGTATGERHLFSASIFYQGARGAAPPELTTFERSKSQ